MVWNGVYRRIRNERPLGTKGGWSVVGRVINKTLEPTEEGVLVGYRVLDFDSFDKEKFVMRVNWNQARLPSQIQVELGEVTMGF